MELVIKASSYGKLHVCQCFPATYAKKLSRLVYSSNTELYPAKSCSAKIKTNVTVDKFCAKSFVMF